MSFISHPTDNWPQACNFIKKETLAQVFSCEFCDISKNTFYYRTRLVAVSGRTRAKSTMPQKQALQIILV